MTTSKTPAELRGEAAAHEQEARDSFERCDTDGFLSQWANGLTASKKHMEASLIEKGGVADMMGLFDLDGNRVRAKIITGQYGLCWAFCDTNDKFIGKFISAFPKRASTMERKGYREDWEIVAVKVEIRGANKVSCQPVYVRLDNGYPEDAKVEE